MVIFVGANCVRPLEIPVKPMGGYFTDYRRQFAARPYYLVNSKTLSFP